MPSWREIFPHTWQTWTKAYKDNLNLFLNIYKLFPIYRAEVSKIVQKKNFTKTYKIISNSKK